MCSRTFPSSNGTSLATIIYHKNLCVFIKTFTPNPCSIDSARTQPREVPPPQKSHGAHRSLNRLDPKIPRKNQSSCHPGWGPALFVLTSPLSWSLRIPWCLLLSFSYFYSEDFYNFTMKNRLSSSISSRQVVVAFETHSNTSIPFNLLNIHLTSV